MKIALISPSEFKTPFPVDFYKVDKKVDWSLDTFKEYKYVLVCGSLGLKHLKLGIPFNKAKSCLLRGKYYCTITPEEANYTPKKKEILENAIKVVDDLYHGKSTTNEVEFTIVDNDDALSAMLFDIFNSEAVSIDTETSGLSPFVPDKWMASLGIATKNHAWTIPLNHKEGKLYGEIELQRALVHRVLKYLKGKTVIGHNGKFDTLWIWCCFGYWLEMSFDTMLAHYNLDENGLHGLDILAAKYLGVKQYDIPVEEKHGFGDLYSHCHYLSMDVRYTYDLYEVFKKMLSEDPMTENLFYNHTMPIARAYARTERNGTYISPQALKESTEYWEKIERETSEKLDSYYPGTNWSSAKQVADVLFNKLGLKILERTPGGTPSCSESVLKRLSDQHEIPKLIIDNRGARKNLSTFLYPWRELMNLSGDDCIHPGFKIHGTVTGRPSSSEPNLQQVPRDPTIRSVIQAPPGWVCIEGDLSQAELRIAAELSQDPELKTCYQTGVDVHTRTVETLFGIDPKVMTKEQRKKGKAVNFGFIYGMGWKKFMEYARDNYGQTFSEEEAQKTRKGFFKLYKALPDWHKKQRNFVHKKGYVRNLIGRKRRLYDALLPDNEENRIKIAQAERNAINSPVQSLASDINLSAFVALSEKYTDPNLVRIEGTIHDAILLIAREDIADQVAYDMKYFMEHPPIFEKMGIKLTVPIVSEVEVGPWSKGTVWSGELRSLQNK